MGREIKFRVWDKKNKIMYNNVELDWTLDEFNSDERFEVMQYTGLKDKNGKEIYENDIIRGVDGSIGVIRYGDHFDYEMDTQINLFGYYVDLPRFQLSLTADSEGWAEVIGNEWENPELIKEA